MSLFRKEAINHSLRRLDGEVLLGTSWSWSLLGFGLVGVVLSGLTFASIASYARTETVAGWLVPRAGIIRMTARAGGILEAVTVREGEIVRLGQPLARIRLSQDTSNGDSGRNLERSALAQIQAAELSARAQVGKLSSDREQLVSQQSALKAQKEEAARYLELLVAKEQLSKASFERAKGLFDKGFGLMTTSV